eukprot:5016702-Pleurochrysis_carterae.AAC.1
MNVTAVENSRRQYAVMAICWAVHQNHEITTDSSQFLVQLRRRCDDQRCDDQRQSLQLKWAGTDYRVMAGNFTWRTAKTRFRSVNIAGLRAVSSVEVAGKTALKTSTFLLMATASASGRYRPTESAIRRSMWDDEARAAGQISEILDVPTH